MKKQLIALALLGLSSTPFAAADTLPLKLSFGGYLQSDYYFFQNNGVTDNFKIRSAAIVAKGQIGNNIKFQLTPDFGQGKVELIDAYLDVIFNPLITLRSGKAKTPFGLERLQSVTEAPFISSGYPTQIAPNRDIGFSIYGQDTKTGLSYNTGVFNGATDGSSTDTDVDNEKEWIGRVFWNPTSELGLGVAQSIGNNTKGGTTTTFSSPGQNKIFTYVSGSKFAGSHDRFSPQFYFFSKNGYGISGEYSISNQAININNVSNSHDTVSNHAYNLVGYYVLTGEAPSYDGLVPNSNFNPETNTWGALELVTHISSLDIDDDAFRNGLASISASITRATTLGAGLNWYLNANTRLSLNLESTSFEGGSAVGNKKGETVISTRFRVKY